MPRRSARRTEKPVEEVAEEEDEVVADETEPDVANGDEDMDQDGETVENGEDSGEQKSLKFNSELSWRPAKPIAVGTLLTRLEALSMELADFEQGTVDLESVKDVAEKLVHRNLLQHKDHGVKAYTACCLVDILRLFAPDAPYTDDQLKTIFSFLIKDILPALFDPTHTYNRQHTYVLMSLTDVKSILLVTELHGADELLLRLFNTTFDGISTTAKSSSDEQLSKDVEIHLTDMLVQLIDESLGSVPASVIDAVISQFLRAAPPGGQRTSKDQASNQSTLLLKTEPPAYIMAKNICNDCADKMARYVSQYFSDVILNASGFATAAGRAQHHDGDSDDEAASAGPSEADLKSLRQAHLLIRELWRAAPTILQSVVPQLEAELSADNVHLRQIATEAFGDMISGIGAAGPPPLPVLDPATCPLAKVMDDVPSSSVDVNVLTKPYSPQSFAQTHHATYRNFVGRKNDKSAGIRAAWATAVGYILSTSAGGIGLSREEESELVTGLRDKLNDTEEKVRLAAVKAIELFEFKDMILKLGTLGGIEKEGSIFASLADRCRDRKASVRVDAMVLLGRLWAYGSGEIADGNEAVISCLGGVPSRIINAFYANDPDLNILLDRVMFECLVPLKYPLIKGKSRNTMSQAEQDRIRAERILLMLKMLDPPAQKAFFGMQARVPQFAKGVGLFIQQCEAYNAGTIIDGNEERVKAGLSKTLQWLGSFFPDPLKVRADLNKFAKLNDRRCYQLVKYAIEAESDFKTVRRAINELISKIQNSGKDYPSCLDTLIPLLYRSSCLMFNRSHLATIMDVSKNDRGGLASVAHSILNDISHRNPDLFKAHAEELRKEIIEKAPTESKPNDPAVVDLLKAFSSYSKKYPQQTHVDKSFSQTLLDYAQYGTPSRAAKYAVNILLAKGDSKNKVTATNLLRKVTQNLDYGKPHFLNKLATISQLERLAPAVASDFDDLVHELTIKTILRQVRTNAEASDPSWVEEDDMNEELRAKLMSLRILTNQVLARQADDDAEERIKPVFKLLKTMIVMEGEFCKTKDTPLHHKKRLRLLAGQLILKLCIVKKYDDQLDPSSFNKLAELVQDSEPRVRRSFVDKLQNYLTRRKLRPRFYTILFLTAFEPAPDLKNRVEVWLRSRMIFYDSSDQHIMEAIMGRLIPLLAHHPDYSSDAADLTDFASYFLFYLNAVATEKNISLIFKYAERVKQTRDGVKPEASENLYVLSDLAQAITRKYQERRGWSFQAWPGKVGLPVGLYSSLPSSEAAQEIAKKQYIPEELDQSLDDLIRQSERKKKRKSIHELADPPAKRTKSVVQTVMRPKTAASKTKSRSKGDGESAPKRSKTNKSRRVKVSPPAVPPGERRRSGRARKASDYKERNDSDDEAEMLDGVAEWDYGDDSEDEEEHDGSSQGEDDDDESMQGEEAEDNEKEEEGATTSSSPGAPRRNGRATAASSFTANKSSPPAIKASVLKTLKDGGRSARSRGQR